MTLLLKTWDEEPISPIGVILYRYVDVGGEVFRKKYAAIRETPKGYWIDADWGQEKFVLKGDGKRFAYPDEAMARRSYIARKKRQLKHLRAQAENVDRVMRWISDNWDHPLQELLEPPKRHFYPEDY